MPEPRKGTTLLNKANYFCKFARRGEGAGLGARVVAWGFWAWGENWRLLGVVGAFFHLETTRHDTTRTNLLCLPYLQEYLQLLHGLELLFPDPVIDLARSQSRLPPCHDPLALLLRYRSSRQPVLHAAGGAKVRLGAPA